MENKIKNVKTENNVFGIARGIFMVQTIVYIVFCFNVRWMTLQVLLWQSIADPIANKEICSLC